MDIIDLIPEDKREEVKGLLSGYVKVEGLDKDGFKELIKTNKALGSVWDAELSTANENYRKKVENEILPARLADERKKIEFDLLPKDPAKIKAMLEVETDPIQKKLLQADLNAAIMAEKLSALEKEAQAKQVLESKMELAKKMKAVITEKGYPLDENDYIDLGEKGIELLAKNGEWLKAKEAEIVEKYKGGGNTAPIAGSPSEGKTLDAIMANKTGFNRR